MTTATTMKGVRKQRTLSRSLIEEGRADFEDGLAEWTLAQVFRSARDDLILVETNDDICALRRVIKALDMAQRRFREALRLAVPPEGQEVLRP